MKILIINTYDINGGAARAAYRLHEGLQKFGIESKMIVQKKFSFDKSVFICKNDLNNKAIHYENLLIKNYPNKSKTLFSTSVISNKILIEFINNSDADIVHLHWIANSFLSIDDIKEIKKPLVWSLHDMWAFTGGCHYDENCKEYERQCGKCRVLVSSLQDDLSHQIWNIKNDNFSKCNNLTIIGLSKWMASAAKKSSLLKNKKIIQLPNPIDCSIFKYEEKKSCRKYFKLPNDKKLILFGAMSATSDPRKGYTELIEALKNVKTTNVEFIIFGNEKEDKNELNHKTHFIGKITDDEILKKLYNAVDVMIVPSKQEAFGQTASESMSCGTPVVSFGHTGLLDIIDHKKNGYLANPFDTRDLAFGIDWVLSNKDYEQLCINARDKVLNSFSYDVVIPKYIELYKNIIHTPIQDINKNINKYSNHHTKILLNIIENLSTIENNSSKTNFSSKYNKFFKEIETLKLSYENYVIYGYGTIGKTIQTLIPDKIVGYVDIADKNNHPRNLINMKYDKIIISVLGREEEIIKYLTEDVGIKKDKIITLEV